MNGNLIVNDEYVTSKVNSLNKLFSQLHDISCCYISILNDVSECGIKDGATAQALRTFVLLANDMLTSLDEIGKSLSGKMAGYVHDIDKADQFLF